MDNNKGRRRFVKGSLACVGALSVGACATQRTDYDALADKIRRPLPDNGNYLEMVRAATLAASSHNTQPWRFRVRQGQIDILPDFQRRTRVVDPDDHHLFASLGCAAENLTLAACACGKSGGVQFTDDGDGRITVDLAAGRTERPDLVQAISQRQCTRNTYDGQPVPNNKLHRAQAAANRYGVQSILITDPKGIAEISAMIVDGNSRQMSDPAFVAELKRWLRFNRRAAQARGDGLYSGSLGQPTLPDWIASTLSGLALNKQAQNRQLASQIQSSSGLMVFVADRDDRSGWINAGRAYERFALQTTVDGLKHAFVNQAVEVPDVRAQLQSLLGIGQRRPDLIVRYGHGRQMPRSLRRPVRAVIV